MSLSLITLLEEGEMKSMKYKPLAVLGLALAAVVMMGAGDRPERGLNSDAVDELVAAGVDKVPR